jgi:hypothetical protein
VSSSNGLPACPLITIDPNAVVTSLVAEGERIYYVTAEGRVMSADADDGSTMLLAETPPQGLNPAIALAVDADYVYFSHGQLYSLSRVPKTGGAASQIATGRIDNAFADASGLYWTGWLAHPGGGWDAKHEVFRRRPDGTVLSLGVLDETYDDLLGIFHGTKGLLVPTDAGLFVFDIEGGGSTKISDTWHISYPLERDGALFFNADFDFGVAHGFFRAELDGSNPEQLLEGPFERGITDGARWVFTMEKKVFAASYPEGDASLVYESPKATSPRAIALTPTRLVLGEAWWEFDTPGIQSLCRDALGL